MKVKGVSREWMGDKRFIFVSFDCGCRATVNEKASILGGCSCGTGEDGGGCIEDMTFAELKDKMQSTIKEWRDELVKSQIQYAKDKKCPQFMSDSGLCFSCGGDVALGYNDRLKTELVTGCCWCMRSYCE